MNQWLGEAHAVIRSEGADKREEQMAHVDAHDSSDDARTASEAPVDSSASGRVYGTPECWPLPWHVERNEENGVDYIVPANVEPGYAGLRWPSQPIFEDGLESFIVQRVNAYGSLLAACKLAEFAFRVPAGTRADLEVAALNAMRMAIREAEGRAS